MMATGVEGEWLTWATGLIGTIAGVLGTLGVALVNRKPSLEAAVDARLKTLIDSYEKHCADLTSEVHALRNEVISLRKALDQTRAAPVGFGL